MLDPTRGLDLGLGYENATSYPVPRHLLFHPGGISETEILLAYGSVRFGSKVGQLAGNHFLTIVEGAEQLPQLGRLTLWQGAQPYRTHSGLERRSGCVYWGKLTPTA
jgi:hypothetical protein